MQVKDVMIPVVGSIEADSTLRDAAETIRALNIDPIPVISDGRVVGVVGENDLSEVAKREVLATGSQRVKNVMSTDIVCCSPDEDVETAIESLTEQGCTKDSARLPVIDASRHLVGIVSLEDLRKRAEMVEEEVTAVSDVESVDSLAHFDHDAVDFMSAESFPASDPIPPPSTMAPTEGEGVRSEK